MERMGLTPDWIIQVCCSGTIQARSQPVQINEAARFLLKPKLRFGDCRYVWEQEAWFGVIRQPLALYSPLCSVGSEVITLSHLSHLDPAQPCM